jgi:hypothetical protein
MGVKAGAFLKKQLEKAGAFKPEKHSKIIDALNELSDDLDDSDVSTLTQSFVTIAEAQSHPEVKSKLKDVFKRELKSEFLDPVDAELKPYEALLGEKEKADYAGLDTTYKKLKYLQKFLSERSSGDGKDAKAYREELASLQKQIKDGDFVAKAEFEKVSAKVSTAQQGKTMAELFALSVPKMSKDRLKDPYVKEDFNSRTNRLLKTNGWVIDHETGEIRKASDPETAVLVEGSTDKMTLEHLPDAYFKNFEDWAQKSDGGGEGELEVERKGAGSTTNSVVERNRQRAQGA